MYKSYTKNKVITILSCVLVLAVIVATAGFCSKLFNKKPATAETPSTVTDENGDILNDGEVHSMPAKMMFARAPMFAAENAAESNSAITAKIAANISPYNATNKKVDWSLSFVNADSEWATGKTVTDYVTATSSTTLSPKEEFSHSSDKYLPICQYILIISAFTAFNARLFDCSIIFIISLKLFWLTI